jgi:hypothetical protein
MCASMGVDMKFYPLDNFSWVVICFTHTLSYPLPSLVEIVCLHTFAYENKLVLWNYKKAHNILWHMLFLISLKAHSEVHVDLFRIWIKMKIYSSCFYLRYDNRMLLADCTECHSHYHRHHSHETHARCMTMEGLSMLLLQSSGVQEEVTSNYP